MANNNIYIKRTSVSGRVPNTTGSYATNSQYIAAGELALNFPDQKLFTSNGTTYFEIGSNVINQNVTNTITVGGSTVNSTFFSATANNSTYLNGEPSSYYANVTSYPGAFNGTTVTASGNPGSGWQFDVSGQSGISLSAGGTFTFTIGSGMIIVNALTTGDCSGWLIGGAGVVLFGSTTNGAVVTTASPPSGKYTIYWNGSNYILISNITSTFNISGIRTGPYY